MGISGVFRRFAEVVLDIDSTELSIEQCRALEEFSAKMKFDTDTTDLKKLMGVLKRKHLVDSICVAKLNGSSIASTNGSSGTECILGTSMFKYINSELPKSESVFVKVDGNWLMIMPYDAKMYIVRAPSNLSTIELKAIAKELERALKRKTAKQS